MKILETERLRLRTVEQGDADFYLAVVNTPGFLEFIGDRGIRTAEAAAKAIADGPMAMQAALGHSIYLVESKDSGQPLGMSGLIKRDTLEHVDIGYAFMPEHCGKGYAHEAAVAVREHARRDIGLQRLLAIVSPGNSASIRLLEKIGMQLDKVVHLTPEDPGTNLYFINFTK